MQLLVEHFPGSRAGQHHLIVYVSQSIVQITDVLQQLMEEKDQVEMIKYRQHLNTLRCWRYFLEVKLLYFDWNFIGFVPEGPIENKSVLAKVMAWCRTGDKPLPEPTLFIFCETIYGH